MIGIVVPAHNEAACIGDCLRGLRAAARHPQLRGEEVCIVVALDRCTDGTAAIAQAMGAHVTRGHAGNVGTARAQGADLAIDAGARWLAFTDADTLVAPDWLVMQLAQGREVVCGTVTVDDWHGHSAAVRRQHESSYVDADDHRHVHGANLGVSAAAYQRVGGFLPLSCNEDVALVEALQASGASIAWSAAPRVVTSARQDFRAPGGFGAAIGRAAERLARGPAVQGMAGTS